MNLRIRVLYVVSTLKLNGPINQLYGIVSNLNMDVFDPYVLTLSPEPELSKKSLFLELPIKVISLDMDRFSCEVFGKKKLSEIIDIIQPEIIHSSGIRADKYLAELVLPCKWCNTIRNDVYKDYIPRYGKILGRIMCLEHLKAFRKINYPICCSNTLKIYYENLLGKKFYAIQNGVDCKRFTLVSEGDKKRLRKEYNIVNDKIAVVCVGGLSERKNPLVLIKAFSSEKIKEKCVLYVIGEGELLEKCREIASDNIFFLGNKKNVEKYLNLMDGYVSASLSEGLPNSVLEAGACGLPMVLSDIPQHKEIFGNIFDGVQYFNSSDENKIVEILSKWLNELDKMNKYKIRNYIVENFDSENTSIEYQRFYLKMLKKKFENF